MRKTFLILLFLSLLSSPAISQTSGLGDENSVNDIFEWYDWLYKYEKVPLKYLNGEKCNQKVIKKYSNGNLKFLAMFRNGLPIGLIKEYYPDGKLKEKGKIKNRKRTGMWEVFHENGKPKILANFNDTIPYPIKCIRYYESGKVKNHNELNDDFWLKADYGLNEKGDTTHTMFLIDSEKLIYLETERYESGKIKTIGKSHAISPFRYEKIGLWKTINEKGEVIHEMKY
jgi:antitoxin component YwqK of YwqJK toxin-antitoxin module